MVSGELLFALLFFLLPLTQRESLLSIVFYFRLDLNGIVFNIHGAGQKYHADIVHRYLAFFG